MIKTPPKIEENLLDKMVRYVAPVKAAELWKARMTLALVNSYTGASRTRRSLSTYLPGDGDMVKKS
jgi:hypothetical protein